jgi:hypothetical protein
VQSQLVYDASPSHNEILPDPTITAFTGIVPNPNPLAGNVLVERYEGIDNPGWLISVMTSKPNYPYLPNDVSLKPTFNIPGTSPNLEMFGYRARSYLVPSETANYQFQVGADDSAFLYLSTGVDPANKVKIAGVDGGGGCAACSYANPSAPIRLNAGQVYYMEALMVEQGGGDWLNVQWKNNVSIPGYVDIPAGNLTLFVDPSRSGLTVAPLPSFTTNACSPVTLTARPSGGDGSFDLHYQWNIDGNPQPGATNATYTSPSLEAGGPYAISVDVTMFGGVKVSQTSTVTIVGDATVPAIVSATVNGAFNKVFLAWNKPVANALNLDHYILLDASSSVIPLTSASIDASGTKVTLFAGAVFASGSTLSLHTEGVEDACGNAMAPNDRSITTPTVLAGKVTFETYGAPGTAGGLGGNDVSALTADPRYPNSPRETLIIGALDTRQGYPDDSHEAYGGRMSGYFTPTATDNYIFYTKGDDGQRWNMNTNDVDSAEPAGATTLIDTFGACCQAYSAHGSSPVHLNAGQRYYIEALWKEGGGGDFQQIAFQPASGGSPDGLPTIGCQYLSTVVDYDVLAARPSAPKRLPTVGKLAPGSLSNRGFKVHFVQVATNINNSTLDAENMVNCLAGPNIAGAPSFNSPLINYTIPDGGTYGHIGGEANFPGVTIANMNNLALEALTYLELQPGLYTLDVNSDDGFRVSPATSYTDPNNSITLGEFSGGRGASDSLFQIVVTEAGLYPFRILWEQGNGGGNVEFDSVDTCPNTVFKLVNDDTGIKAYLPPTSPVDTVPPVIVNCPTNRNVVITNGCSTVVPNLLPEFAAYDCQSVTTTSQSPAAGTVISAVGTAVTVTLTARDDSGNSVTCTTTLTTVDGAAPVITACAPATSVPANASCQGVVPDLTGGVTATDGCGGAVIITQSPAAGSTIPAGPNAVTLKATDAAGNFSTCVTTVSVVPPGPTPSLAIAVSGSGFKLTWTSSSPCWKVQGASALATGGPSTWTTLTGTSPMTVPNDSQMKFFRLVAAP